MVTRKKITLNQIKKEIDLLLAVYKAKATRPRGTAYSIWVRFPGWSDFLVLFHEDYFPDYFYFDIYPGASNRTPPRGDREAKTVLLRAVTYKALEKLGVHYEAEDIKTPAMEQG